MASTYKPSDAFDIAKRYLKNMPLEQVGARILDTVSKYIWMAAPWRWTIGAMPVTTLINNTQDYPIVLPADFLFITDAYQTDQAGSIVRKLETVPALPAGGQKGNITQIAISGSAGGTGTLRTFPQPPALNGTQYIIAKYKKTSPVFTPANIYTAGGLVMDDEWIMVFESGVKWLAYMFGDDSRAGSATVADGKVSFTGQRAQFEADLLMMMQREKLPVGEK